MKQNLNCSGSTRIDGGEYGEVRVSASLRVDGDLRCDALQCSGSAKIEGALSCAGEVRCSGSVKVAGEAAMQDGRFSGSVKAQSLRCAGTLHCSGSAGVEGGMQLGKARFSGSCAAEGVTNERNGLLIEENALALAQCLRGLSKEAMALIGRYAQEELYLSWEDAVATAQERYQIVIDRYRSGAYAPYRKHMEPVFKANGELMEGLAKLEDSRQALRSRISDLLAESKEHLKDIL